VRKVHRVTLVTKALKEQIHKVIKELKVHKVLGVMQVILEYKVLKEHKAHKEHKVQVDI